MLPKRSSKILLRSESTKETSDSDLANDISRGKTDPICKNGSDKKEKTKNRRSCPSPTPVQSNPIFQHSFGKSILSSQIRQRRGSFLYKQDSSSNIGDVISPKLPSSKSVSFSASNEDFIVTPFAQILSKLRSVRANHVELTNLMAPKSSDGVWIDTPRSNLSDISNSRGSSPSSTFKRSGSFLDQENNEFSVLAKETLDDLDWCLGQLSKMKSRMSVSSMARNKFKSMMNEQLSTTIGDDDLVNGIENGRKKSNHQTQEYILSTFLDRETHLQKILPVSHSEPNTITPNTPIRALRGSISLIDDSLSPQPVDTIPKFGITCGNELELEKTLTKMNNWGMDIFHLDKITNQQPLTAIVYNILLERNLLSTFKIPRKTCLLFLKALESSYVKDVPYHNSKHAADVTQTTHVLLNMDALEDVFTPLEILAALFASAIHDAGHPGVTNQFLVNTSSELALLYNDESVLENYHVSTAFKLLQKEECNIIANFSKEERINFRKMVIDLVLATDMSKHMTLLADMKTMIETKDFTESEDLKLEDYSDRILVLQTMLHCADLSNPAKPLPLYIKWCELVMEEFFQQGDRERKLNLEISAMCDRNNAAIEKTQVGFIDFVVRPVWETWADLVNPGAQDILENLECNKQYYQAKIGALRSRTASTNKDSLKEEEEENDSN